jgi:hypothetical protein
MVFMDGGDKRTWVDWFAHCKAVAPYKPAYWLEGPNWTVSIQTDVSDDDSVAAASARRTAGMLGARLQRSCAPSERHPATPIRSHAVGEPFTLYRELVVEGISDPYLPSDGTKARPGYRLVRVTILDNGGPSPSSTALPCIWLGLHAAGSERYYEPLDETSDPRSGTAESAPAGSQGSYVDFEVPASLAQLTLRLSPADDYARPADLVDVPLD